MDRSRRLLLKNAKAELGWGISLVGGLAIPAHGFIKVGGDPVTFDVHRAEVELRQGIALLGSPAVPVHRLLIVLWPTLPIYAHHPQIDLSGHAALFRRLAIPLARSGVVALGVTVLAPIKILLRR